MVSNLEPIEVKKEQIVPPNYITDEEDSQQLKQRLRIPEESVIKFEYGNNIDLQT